MQAQAHICMICHDDHSMPGTDSEGRSYGRLCKFDDMLVRITTLEAENAELRRRVEAAELKALVYDRISEHGFTLRFDKGQTLGDCFAAVEAGR